MNDNLGTTENLSPSGANQAVPDSKIEGKESRSMRVIMITNEGEMLTLFLPASMEGRYRFTSSSGLEDFPFFFEQRNGIRTVVLERRARFFYKNSDGENITVREQPLISGSFLKLRHDKKKYILYAEDERPDDHVFIPYYFEHSDYSIGRSSKCAVCYKHHTVSREHARLHWNGSAWELTDCDSTNGTYVNGKKIDFTELKVGDVVFIVGLYIVVGASFLSMNNTNGRVVFSTPMIHRINEKKDFKFSRPVRTCDPFAYYDRKPRRMLNAGVSEIEVEMPPFSIKGNNIPLLLRMGSPMVMGGHALMTGNIFMAMTGMMMPMLTQGFTEKDRREYEKKRVEGYSAYLNYLKTEIKEEKRTEETNLNFNYPPLNNAMYMAYNDQRLWDRRQNDEDFLKIRIGNGDYPMLCELKYNKRKFQIEPDELETAMYNLVDRPVILRNVPVMHSLTEDYVSGISGDRTAVLELIRNMIMQLVTSHSYDEVKLVILAEGSEAEYFDFVRYLPHNWSNTRNMRFFITEQAEAQQMTNYLNTEFEEILKMFSKQYKPSGHISYVVFALSKELYNQMEIFKTFLSLEEYRGISIVTAFEGLPKECAKVIDMGKSCRIIDYNHVETEDMLFSPDPLDDALFRKTVGTICSKRIRVEGESYLLPNMLTFLEMFNVGRVEHLNPLKRWAENNPIKSLGAPVGLGSDGKLFYLDLHEKHHGPHGLVAGMTGSGKSEFLITYILSMAVCYSPDEVAFVLIDYKGGGLADAFEDKKRGLHLPHLVGTITNLDGAAIQRSLMSIKSELKRRQAVFKRAKSATNQGTMDIYDYQKLYRDKLVSEPLPHLIIISDEFAEMKAQQPEFMNELISTARIGRSLGVHLILATQRPSGVVNDQIRSNTKFQVCLRVQDRSDSMDMINRPDAAELKQTGRFYIQVGYNEFFTQGQSAWCGAEYSPQDEVVEAKDYSVAFVDNLGQTLHSVSPEVKAIKTDVKQVVSIAKYLSDLAQRENILPRRLWIDPLPTVLDFDDLMRSHSDDGFMRAVVGMVDYPETQSRFPLVIDFMKIKHALICGSSASGKSVFIKTLVMSLAEKYSPEEFNCYITELGSTALSGLSKLPHCGAYVTDSSENDFYRLFDFLNDVIEERKAIFAEAEVTNYDAYIQTAKMPLITVIIDGFTNIKMLSKGGEYHSTIHEHLRAATGCGIKYVLTFNNPNEVSLKTKQEADFRLALNAKDKYVYSDILEIRCRMEPPQLKGRGLCVSEGQPLEFQTAILYASENEQTRAAKLRKRIKELTERFKDVRKAKTLPTIKDELEYGEFCIGFKNAGLPLGYLVREARPVLLPLQQFYSVSVYLGNPAGIKPVFSNFITAAVFNCMDIAVVRRQSGTIFDGEFEKNMRENYPGKLTLLDSTESGLADFDSFMVEEITKRNVFRDEYSRIHGIPLTEKDRARRAIRYIRERTKPCMVIFESFSDFCSIEKDENMQIEINALISKTRGYNMYFVAGFYPTDSDNLMRDPTLGCFNEDELFMLFGGRYDKIKFTNPPMDLRRIEQVNPNYNRFVLKYRGNFHPFLMPCGKLSEDSTEPDEAPII